jgi:hypothetical protein
VLVCEPLIGWRVIATPAALDITEWPVGSLPLRISPDDVFIIGEPRPEVPDEHAIVVVEHGFHGLKLANATIVADIAERHVEWQLPVHRPALAQGQIAGVPAKLWLRDDGSALLLVASAARHELEARLNA